MTYTFIGDSDILYNVRTGKRAGEGLTHLHDSELNTERHATAAFFGDPHQQVNADTLLDFENDVLYWSELVQNPEVQNELEELWKKDTEFQWKTKDAQAAIEQGLLESYEESYLTLLSRLVSEAKRLEGSSERGRILRQLELMLRWKCCLISSEDRLLIPVTHPMERAIRALKDQIASSQGDKAGTLTWEILETRKKRYSRYLVYSMEQVYLRTGEERRNAVEAVPFYEAGSLTEISSIRFIEKVEHFYRTKGIGGQRDCREKPIRIACLGEVKEPNALIDYYNGKQDQKILVELVELKQAQAGKQFLFAVKEGYPENAVRKEDRRIFNLLVLSDLEALFKQYDIVLFLDEGCFYRQGQDDRTLEERMVQQQLQWLMDTAKREKKPENRILQYKKAFEMTGEWLSSININATARMQFHDKLFGAIQSVMTPEYEVYLYVSYGEQIAGRVLYNRDVCNDENYDGREVSVYKMPSREKDISDAVLKFLQPVSNKKIEIDFWKLVKSISNDYYLKFLKKAGIIKEKAVNETKNNGIRLLRHTALEISWPESLKNEEKIRFQLRTNGDEAYCQQTTQFMEEFLEAGFVQPKHSCVKEYLHKLLGNAVVSRAANVEGILLGYLLKNGFFDARISWEGIIRETGDRENMVNSRFFEPRRAILSVIDNLNMAWIRDYEKKKEFLLYDFRPRYCPGLSEEVFWQLMSAVNEACSMTGYVDSRLYHHSSL